MFGMSENLSYRLRIFTLIVVASASLLVSCGEEGNPFPYCPQVPTLYNRHETSDAQRLLDDDCAFVPSQQVVMVAVEKVNFLCGDRQRSSLSFDTAGHCLEFYSRDAASYEHRHFEYDSLGRRIKEVYYFDTLVPADESRLAPYSITTYTYKRDSRLCKAVIQGGQGRRYRFRLRYGTRREDGSRLLTDYIFPDGSRYSYDYDSAGRLVRKTAPDGTYEKYTYDSQGRLSSSATPSENGILNFDNTTYYVHSTELQCDEQGRIIQRQNGQLVETYLYDEYGNWIVCTVTCDGEPFCRTTRQFTYW